jgi:hypothetical protein
MTTFDGQSHIIDLDDFPSIDQSKPWQLPSSPSCPVLNMVVARCGEIISNLFIFVLVSSLPIAMIAVGGSNTGDCPIQPWIPIYLIINGCTAIVAVMVGSALISSLTIKSADVHKGSLKRVNVTIQLFAFCWTIPGSIWTFGAAGLVQYRYNSLSNYCDQATFQLAFWSLIFHYTGLFILILGEICRRK